MMSPELLTGLQQDWSDFIDRQRGSRSRSAPRSIPSPPCN